MAKTSNFAAQRAGDSPAAPKPQGGAQAPQAPGGQFAQTVHGNFIENIKLLDAHPDEVKPEFIAFLQLLKGGSQQDQQAPPTTRAPSAPAPTGPPAQAAPAPMAAAR